MIDVTRTCPVCGKTFTPSTAHPDQKYDTITCYRQAAKKPIKTNCHICGAEIERVPVGKKYVCSQCRSKYKSKNLNRPRIMYCVLCGVKIVRQSYLISRGPKCDICIADPPAPVFVNSSMHESEEIKKEIKPVVEIKKEIKPIPEIKPLADIKTHELIKDLYKSVEIGNPYKIYQHLRHIHETLTDDYYKRDWPVLSASILQSYPDLRLKLTDQKCLDILGQCATDAQSLAGVI
jgi:hypothetical protein